jgi:hypothetical protein
MLEPGLWKVVKPQVGCSPERFMLRNATQYSADKTLASEFFSGVQVVAFSLITGS